MKPLKIFISFLLISFAAQSQNLKSAFKYISSNNFDRAKVVFEEAKNNPSLSSIANYGIAIIYSNDGYRSKDYYRAFEAINISISDFGRVDASQMGKLSDFLTGIEDIKRKRNEIDDKLVSEVKAANTIEASEKFLAQAKLSSSYKEVSSIYSLQRYKQASDYNTINAFQDFIKEFPEAREVKSAQENIYILAYKEAVNADNLERYSYFVKIYPEAPQVIEIQDKMIDKEYEMVLLTGTDDAFDNFIDKYPDTKQSDDLKNKQLQMNYLQAKQLNTLSVYNNFIRKFPISPYTAEFTEIRDSLAFLEAKKINTVESYKDFVNNYPNAKQTATVLKFQKDLSYSKAELAYIKEKEKYASKNIKIVEYLKLDKKDSTIKQLFKTIEFDEFGNVIREIETSATGAKITTIRNFSKNGRQLLEEMSTQNNDLIYKVKYSYNNKGLLDSAQKTYADNCKDDLPVGTYTIKYRYDNSRNLAEKSLATYDNISSSKHSYTYNNQNLVAQEFIETNLSGKISKIKVNYQYDFYENLIQKTVFSDENAISSVETYFYDKAGNMTKFSMYDAFGKIKKAYKFNENGLPISTVVEFPNDTSQNYKMVYNYILRK